MLNQLCAAWTQCDASDQIGGLVRYRYKRMASSVKNGKENWRARM